MPPVVLERLFDPLHQTSRPGTDGETGTGFGMPLVRKFMTLFGGGIEVQSRDVEAHPSDHGTEITLDFRAG
jgi:signal transduction histidine kinase